MGEVADVTAIGENLLRLVRPGADEHIDPTGEELGEQRGLLRHDPLDEPVEVRAPSQLLGKRRVGLEHPSVLGAVLHEYEGAIPYGTL
jgi:hypothetical protein